MHDTCAGGTCRMCSHPVILFIACEFTCTLYVYIVNVIMCILSTNTCVLYRGIHLLMTFKRKEKTDVKQQGRGIT